jgi:hypothetical protein
MWLLSLAWAAPVDIPIVGLISTDAGWPTGTHQLTVRLYADASDTTADLAQAGDALFQEGSFAVRISVEPAWFGAHPSPQVTVAIDDGPESDRTPLASAPLAAWAHRAGAVPASGVEGVLSASQLPESLVYAGGAGFTGAVTGTSAAFSGTVSAGGFSGSGAGLSDLPAGALTGVISDGRLPTDLVRTSGATFLGAVAAPSFSGSGAGLTNVPAGAITGLASASEAAIEAATLDGLRLGNVDGDCSTAAERGRIRWNGTNFQGCGATGWINFGAATATADGSSAANAAEDCRQLRSDMPSLASGAYWIDPGANGDPYRAWCDMVADGGGWTLVVGNRGAGGDISYATFTNTAVNTEYTVGGNVVSKARQEVAFSKIMFVHPSGTTYATTGAQPNLLALPPNTAYTRTGAAFPNTAYSGGGTESTSVLYYRKTPTAAHRNYIWSKYDTNSLNQDGMWCWSGLHCSGGELGGTTGGTWEIFVR